jgi:hypothetical protein
VESQGSLPHSQVSVTCPYPEPFCDKIHFYCKELSAPVPTPKLEDHSLLAVRDCLFSIFAATHHLQPEDEPCRGGRDPTYHGHHKCLLVYGSAPLSGSRPPLCWCFAIRVTHATQSAGLPWMSVRLVAEGSTSKHNAYRRRSFPRLVRTRNALKRAVADPRLRTRGHWHRHLQRLVIWYDIYIYIYYLTAVGLTSGGNSTLHIYTQTIHRIQATEHT